MNLLPAASYVIDVARSYFLSSFCLSQRPTSADRTCQPQCQIQYGLRATPLILPRPPTLHNMLL